MDPTRCKTEVGLNKCGFTPYDILAFFGKPVFLVLLPLVTFWPFLPPPSPLTFHNVKNDGNLKNKRVEKKEEENKEQETEK